MKEDYDVVVVGAGPAGSTAAEAAAARGIEVALIERKGEIGHLFSAAASFPKYTSCKLCCPMPICLPLFPTSHSVAFCIAPGYSASILLLESARSSRSQVASLIARPLIAT